MFLQVKLRILVFLTKEFSLWHKRLIHSERLSHKKKFTCVSRKTVAHAYHEILHEIKTFLYTKLESETQIFEK